MRSAAGITSAIRSLPVATQPAMAVTQTGRTTNAAIVSMCGMRNAIEKSASAPPITKVQGSAKSLVYFDPAMVISQG